MRISALVVAASLAMATVGAVTPTLPGEAGASSQTFLALWPVSASAAWAVTVGATSSSRQAVSLTTDGGRSWSVRTPAAEMRTGGSHWIDGSFALSASRAWIAVGGVADNARRRLMTTGDGGRRWSDVGALPPLACLIVFTSASDGTCTEYNGAAGSMPIILYRTADGGRTWRKIYDDVKIDMGATYHTPKGDLPFMCDKTLGFTSATIGWAAFFCNGPDAVLYRTRDGGRTWTAVSVTQPSPPITGGAGFEPPVVRGSTGAAAFQGGADSLVFVTRDGGRSFSPVYPPGPRKLRTVDVVSPAVWRLLSGNEVLGTNDAGATWFTVHGNASSLVPTSPYRATAPSAVWFYNRTTGWLTWTGPTDDDIVMHTTDDGRHWRVVAIPGLGRGGAQP